MAQHRPDCAFFHTLKCDCREDPLARMLETEARFRAEEQAYQRGWYAGVRDLTAAVGGIAGSLSPVGRDFYRQPYSSATRIADFQYQSTIVGMESAKIHSALQQVIHGNFSPEEMRRRLGAMACYGLQGLR